MDEKEDLPFCKCGCGKRVSKKGNKWINGHNSKGENNSYYGKKHSEEVRDKIRISKIVEKITKICKYCRNPYDVLPSDNTIFCCRECFDNYRNRIIITKICEYCGHTFEVDMSVREQTFCSRKCAAKGRKRKTKSEIDKFIEENTDKHLCKCGCGRFIVVLRDHYTTGIPEYIHGHAVKGKNNPMYGSCRCGENSPHWKGGTTNPQYCHKFNESLKDAHRRYFNYVCFMDNEPENNGNNLSDHHVGYDKRCGCNATQFCIFVPVTKSWNTIFNGNKEHNRWYWYSFLMNKIFIEHPNYFTYHIPVWGMNELEYNYNYVFEKFRRR